MYMGHDVCIGVQTSVTVKVFMSVQVVHCFLVVTGFRACGIIHIKWPNLHFQQAQQRVSPQPFDMLSIGIGEHKVNQTGKLERTYITRHAKAEQDPFAALANLLAHEIDNNGFSLIDMLQSGSIDSKTCQQLLWGSRVFFPNIDRDNLVRTSQIESLLESVVKEISVGTRQKINILDCSVRLLQTMPLLLEQPLMRSTDILDGRVMFKEGFMLSTIQKHTSTSKQCWQDFIKTAGNKTTTWEEL